MHPISRKVINRLQNSLFFDPSIIPLIKASTPISDFGNQKRNNREVSDGTTNHLLLPYGETFFENENLIKKENDFNTSTNSIKRNFISKVLLANKTKENGKKEEDLGRKDNVTKKKLNQELSTLLPIRDFLFKHTYNIETPSSIVALNKCCKKAIKTTKSMKQKEEIRSNRNERETTLQNLGLENQTKDQKSLSHRVLEKEKKMKLLPLALKLPKPEKEEDESSMFMRHNITVETLNHGKEKKRYRFLNYTS